MALRRIGPEHVRNAIATYLTRYPDARDSSRGVAVWCEAILGLRPAEDLLTHVLDAMEAQGLLAAVRLPDGAKVYSAPGAP